MTFEKGDVIVPGDKTYPEGSLDVHGYSSRLVSRHLLREELVELRDFLKTRLPEKELVEEEGEGDRVHTHAAYALFHNVNLAILSIDRGHGHLQASPCGGGTVYSFPKAKVEEYMFRKVSKEEIKNAPIYRTHFALDDSPVFLGWTDGTSWNGFGTPSFEKEAADWLMKWFNEISLECKMQYDEKRDAFIWPDGKEGEEPNVVEGHDLAIGDGKKVHVYDIGSHYWTWSEL